VTLLIERKKGRPAYTKILLSKIVTVF